jgi:hypothetical protein
MVFAHAREKRQTTKVTQQGAAMHLDIKFRCSSTESSTRQELIDMLLDLYFSHPKRTI